MTHHPCALLTWSTPNNRLEPTPPSSLRYAAASGRGSGAALGKERRKHYDSK
jgi:hypothetical protein